MISDKKLRRLDFVQSLVFDNLLPVNNSLKQHQFWSQLSGVSNFASMLAIRRGQDPEKAAIAGLLHNYYFVKTGVKTFPGHNSADAVRPILRSSELFSDEEMSIILRSIFYQDDRQRSHGPYEEILKDAILLQMYFHNTDRHVPTTDIHRLQNVLRELGMPEETVKAVATANHIDSKLINLHREDRRSMLADYAETLAKKNIIGVPENEVYREICKYWPDTDIYKVLESNWCAAFVYHCCMQVGILLPIRYPNHMFRLAGVGALLDWAKLPETGFFNDVNQEEFNPARGDIVIFEKLLTDQSHDHIGIVLACDDHQIKVAEGNVDNKNVSSVLYRDRSHCILGYIRIGDIYQYQFNGEYIPIP
ncbi:CHAP domain-containing protein [Paenibacillus sp. GYB006]|uniref:CHAP domain-containing protein n=1 Tax=Paenibacillus sp. GYB006 TaxID=2994394 RepID=UPI002F96C4E5